MLEVKDLKKYFKLSGKRQLWAVNGISFKAQNNEVLGIVGESGCGKSTLGRLILRLIEPSSGQIFFNSEEITGISRRVLEPKRRNMQMVFQNPFASFNPKIRIGSALTEVCLYYGMSAGESREKIKQRLNDTGLSEDLLNRWPRELSGGQLQRLAITRAILSEPSLLVADEPLASLDVSVQAQLLNLFEDLRKINSMMMIFISHDMNVVEYFCDRAAVMYMGVIMELVPASELPRNSLHPYTKSLRSSAPRLDVFKDSPGIVQNTQAFKLKGEAPTSQIDIPGCPFAPRCPEAKPVCGESMPELREVSQGHWVCCHFS
ncbi:MAG: ABC transporter ATP-binding protein [Treponema sp.]|nr:ABC transporter ATP-binding protein [Treponema sp.]